MIPREDAALSAGAHPRAYDHLGAHPETRDGVAGTRFAVWAPNSPAVSVIGDFNGWDAEAHPLQSSDAGIWHGFVAGASVGARYKFSVVQADSGRRVEKADPYAFRSELRPSTASLIADVGGYEWGDEDWMARRSAAHAHDAPMSIYEVHLGSWARVPEEEDRWLTYGEAGPRLARYAREMGYTHVELMPLAEHALDESWGYQTVSYYAATSRFGDPHGLMGLVDALHQEGVGVILDWVPAHFPSDEHGLARFDGTHLYEHADPRMGYQPDWGTCVFNYGRQEVANFLLANALFWMNEYHVDGLRVDAVASMLYRDYSRPAGQWIPNQYGGREHIEAIDFLRRVNDAVTEAHPDALMIAEESTSWPMVSRPTYAGGLGFSHKWNMGWMHDTLSFMSRDPLFRGHHLGELTFSLVYAYHERFVLPYSHDEVVHLKGSMLTKMPGDEWHQFANLRTLYGYMYGHPGRKLLFMGSEFAQRAEWNAVRSLDWNLLEDPAHRGVQRWVRDLNHFYREEPALHARDDDADGFEWIDFADTDNVVVSFVRHAPDSPDVVFICNFTSVPREGYRVGVPGSGEWELVLNSDGREYGGTGYPTAPRIVAQDVTWHGRDRSVVVDIPPLCTLALRRVIR